jgi:hypothetical protein
MKIFNGIAAAGILAGAMSAAGPAPAQQSVEVQRWVIVEQIPLDQAYAQLRQDEVALKAHLAANANPQQIAMDRKRIAQSEQVVAAIIKAEGGDPDKFDPANLDAENLEVR